MSPHYRVVVAALLVFVAACGGKSEQTESGSEAASNTESVVEVPTDTTAARAALTVEQNERVQRAVKLAKAIQNDPAAAVRILAEQGLTPEQWSALLEEIARDPALAAAYEAGMR